MISESDLRWRRTDESDWLAHCPNHRDFYLFYGRIYTVGMGFSYSKTNQLISNLKIPPGESQSRRWHKERAIEQFAQEVVSLLKTALDPERHVTLIPMPPSKTKTHPQYDNRIERVAGLITKEFFNVECWPILTRIADTESYHQSGSYREPDDIYNGMAAPEEWREFWRDGSILLVLDDILTSGAHFVAA